MLPPCLVHARRRPNLPTDHAQPHETKACNHLHRKHRLPEVTHPLLLYPGERVERPPTPESGLVDVAHAVVVDATHGTPQLDGRLYEADEPEDGEDERHQKDREREQEVDVIQRDDGKHKDYAQAGDRDEEIVIPTYTPLSDDASPPSSIGVVLTMAPKLAGVPARTQSRSTCPR